jgi:hypothetical protein
MISFLSSLLENPTMARWTLVICVAVQVVPFLLALIRGAIRIIGAFAGNEELRGIAAEVKTIAKLNQAMVIWIST